MMFLLIAVRTLKVCEVKTREVMDRLSRTGEYRLPTPYEQEQHAREKRKNTLLTE